MIKFFLSFLVIQSFLFTLTILPSVFWSVVIPFTKSVAATSAWLIMLFDANVLSDGIMVRNASNGFAVTILPGCNGLEAVVILVSAMLAFHAPWVHKLVGILLGFLLVQVANILRIISLFYLGQWNMNLFEWAHLYIWQALIMLDALIIFLIWLRFLPCKLNQSLASS